MESNEMRGFEPVDIRAIPDDQLDGIVGGSGYHAGPATKVG